MPPKSIRNAYNLYQQVYKRIFVYIIYKILLPMLSPQMHKHKTSQNLSNPPKITSLPTNIASTLLQYIDNDDLNNLAKALHEVTGGQSMKKICQVSGVFRTVVNRADRGYYFELYEMPQYIAYENKRIQQLALSGNGQNFATLPLLIKQIMKQIAQDAGTSIGTEVAEKVQQFFLDPFLPMPKLMRETVTAQANSTYQFFLLEQVDSDYENSHLINEQVFQQLQETLTQNQQSFMRSLAKNPQLFTQLRLTPHNIKFSDHKTKLIARNELHNLVVSLFAMTELMLSRVEMCLEGIQDSFELMLELTVRYTQFINTVMSVEENLGFIFKNYGAIYDEIGVKPATTRMSYHKPALTMWLSKMQKFHSKTNQSYLELLYTAHNNAYIRKCDRNSPQTPCTKLDLLAQIHHKHRQPCENNVVYGMMTQERNSARILLKLYEEYLIDCSVEDGAVHSCGHSEQVLGRVFEEAQSMFLEKEEEFVGMIRQASFQDEDKVKVNEYLEKRLKKFVDLLKPRTLKACIDIYKVQCSELIANMKTIDEQIQKYINFLIQKRGYRRTESKDKLNQSSGIEQDRKSATESTNSESQKESLVFETYETDNEEQEMMDIEENNQSMQMEAA